jgi:hypothetical protein
MRNAIRAERPVQLRAYLDARRLLTRAHDIVRHREREEGTLVDDIRARFPIGVIVPTIHVVMFPKSLALLSMTNVPKKAAS